MMSGIWVDQKRKDQMWNIMRWEKSFVCSTYNPSLPNMGVVVKQYLIFAMKTLRRYFQPMLLISYIDAARILKNYFLPLFLLIIKLLKEIVAIFVRFFYLTWKYIYLHSKLNYNSWNVIYFVQRSNCTRQNVGSPWNFKQRFRIHISDIKINKDRCGTSRLFKKISCHLSNPHSYLQFRLKEQVHLTIFINIYKLLCGSVKSMDNSNCLLMHMVWILSVICMPKKVRLQKK